jgi:hypothetical protein
MGGHKPQEVIVYNTKGKYIRTFESISEFRQMYYPNTKGTVPLFLTSELGEKYEYLDKLDLIGVLNKIGREKIKKILAIHNCTFCKNRDNLPSEQPIICLNRKGEIIAEFKTLRLLKKLMPHIPEPTLTHQLNNKKNVGKNRYTSLLFQYKK